MLFCHAVVTRPEWKNLLNRENKYLITVLLKKKKVGMLSYQVALPFLNLLRAIVYVISFSAITKFKPVSTVSVIS